MATTSMMGSFARGATLAGIVGTSVLVQSERPAFCQFGGCVNTASGVTNPPALEPIIATSETCKADGLIVSSTLGDGAWMRSGKSVNVGASASTTGQCNKFGWNPYPSNCASFGTELRNIQHIFIYEVLPSGAQNPSWPYLHLTNQADGGSVYLQSIDSRVTGSTNGPFPFLLSAEGAHDFRHYVLTTPTVCSIQPTTHQETHRQVNVISCKPEWWYQQDAQGNFIPGSPNYQPPPGPITINIPPGFEDAEAAVRAAAAAWATATGRVINVNMNATCSGGSGSCVTIKADHGTLPGDEGCASLGTSSPSPTGEWTDTMSVRLEPGWATASSSRLQRLIAHELGHYFGLWNRMDPSCASGPTVMDAATGPCYDSSAYPAGEPLGPTASDVAAIQNGVYGKKNRTVCGW